MNTGKREMNCEEVLGHLFEYLDGELDGATEGEIEHHLERCRGCFSRAEFERRLKRKLSETAETEAPQSLRSRVRALIERF
jgi:anti-sigma factor (TIGR02949 family)